MSQILNKVRDVDPNNSDAVKEVLSTFFLNLSKHTEVDCNRWLRALENIINRFPKYCGSHRNTIETYLITFIDSNNYYNVIEAAKCAHALQQVRPSQDKKATAKACWREHLNILCNAAHKIIGALFPNSVDMYKGNDAQILQVESSATSPFCTALAQILSIPKVQNKTMNKQTLLSIRLRNVFVFIQATFVETYPVAKPIQPQLVLEVIVRALSISSGVKQAHDITKSVAVKIQALRTLDALIACLGPNLIPFSGLIFKFVILTLKWCKENMNEETREVRRTAYDTLRRWLDSLHTYRLADSPRGRDWEDEITQHIVDDITPPRHIVQLTMSSQPTRHLSKKAKRKLANAMLQESSISSHASSEKNKVPMSQESNDEIAIAALDCAETFLNVCGIFMKSTTHKLLQERLVRECYNLNTYCNVRALGLVRVLDALRKNTPSTVPPPTQYCLQLYSDLVNSRAAEVSKFCSQALLDIRLHLHCSPPTLNFAIEVESTYKKNNKPKKLSSRNRAALENLLGVEKIPRDTNLDITGSDGEPSKKKPKIVVDDEVAEEISVSSESDVICDEISSDSDEVEEVTTTIDVDNDNEVENNDAEPSNDNLDPDDSRESAAQEAEDDDDDDEDVVDAVGDTTSTGTQEKAVSSGEATEENSQELLVTSQNTNDEQSVKELVDNCSKDSNESDRDDTQDSTSNRDTQESLSNRDTQDSVSNRDTVDSSSNNDTQESELKDDSSEATSKGSTKTQDKNKESASSNESDYTQSSQDDSKTKDNGYNIHEARTQLPLSGSVAPVDEPRSPRSMEVEIAYDFPNTSETRVTILEKTEDDNLPSTNETDDVPITCGQVVKSSQELEIEKNKEVENKENEVPKVNGDGTKDKTTDNKATESITEKNGPTKEVNVEDMLADFVDEINEENKAGA